MARVSSFDTIFSYAFRPLFMLLGAYGLLVIPYWVLAWSGYLPLPSITLSPLVWHGHEMLFGFTSAAIAGFLLTAVANWTQRPPVSGFALFLLCALWLSARIVWCLHGALILPFAAAFDVGFDGLLLALFLRELIAAKNWRNLKVAFVLSLYFALNVFIYFLIFVNALILSHALIATIYLIVLLINIIGGRIIPLFTGNWLRQRAAESALPPAFNRFDLAVVVMTALFMLAALAELPGAGLLGIVAGFAQLLRLRRWRGWRTASEPLLWSLHLGYLWLAVGLILNGMALLDWIPASAYIHALTVGAISGLVIAVAGRVSLGHTGRALTSHPLLTTAFVFINIAAVARVLAAVIPDATTSLLFIAALLWLIALATFCIRYFPILVSRNPG